MPIQTCVRTERVPLHTRLKAGDRHLLKECGDPVLIGGARAEFRGRLMVGPLPLTQIMVVRAHPSK